MFFCHLTAISRENIKRHISDHFILYDYKGNIESNNPKAIRIIKGIYGENVNIDGDGLYLSDSLLDIDHSDVSGPFETNQALQYWHMQLHPNNQKWGKEQELLRSLSLIGLEKDKTDQAFLDFERMRINDVVLIKKGSKPIALTKVIGELEESTENINDAQRLDWFRYRRKVAVLGYATSVMDTFPHPRGTISLVKDKNTATFKYIDSWYDKINYIENPIKIPREIEISSAKPSFGVNAIAKTLSSIITNIPDKSGMMVGVFGRWGRGKTYLVNSIWNEIENSSLEYKRVNFSAWKYQETRESWAYLYETMMNQFLSDGGHDSFIKSFVARNYKLFKLNVQKHRWFPLVSFSLIIVLSIYWTFLGGSFDIMNFMISSFGVVALFKLFLFYLSQKTTAIGLLNKYLSRTNYSDYLGMQAEVENELEILVKTWIPTANAEEKIILFVDDVDRCEISKIVKLIDGLRIILDNEEIHNRLVIITAIDEEILERAILHKYSDFEPEKAKYIYQEYLEKIFIIGVKLNSLNDDEVEEYLVKLLPDNIDDIRGVTNNNTDDVDDFINDKLNVRAKNEFDSNLNSTVEINSDNISTIKDEHVDDVEGSPYELSKKEKVALVISIKNLEKATPRKIRIFYYKYLILKKIFHVRLVEKQLISKWDINSDEKVIMDILIHVSNKKALHSYNYDLVDNSIMKELEYSVNMLSVL
jgi:hypothetical protein